MNQITHRLILACTTIATVAATAAVGCGSDGTDSRSCTTIDSADDLDGGAILSEDNCYEIDGQLTVTDGELIIGGDTTVYFGADAGLTIDGDAQLTVQGGDETTVELRGDQAEAGFWRGVRIRSAGPHFIEDARIAHGGAGEWDHDDYHLQGGVVVDGDDVQLTVRNTRFDQQRYAGLTTVGAAAEVYVIDSTFEDNDAPLRLHPNHVAGLDEDLEFSDNQTEAVRVHTDDDLSRDSHWQRLQVPYLVDQPIGVVAVLTVESGVTIRFDEHAGLDVNGGVLQAVASEEQPVRFIGDNDVAGWWRGLRFRNSDSAQTSQLEHVEVVHGGSERWEPTWSNSAANILVHDGGRLIINHIRVAHSDYHGISIRDGDVSGCTDIEYEDYRRHAQHTYDDDEGC